MEAITLTSHPTNGFTLSAIIDGYYVARMYIGYSVKEARLLFLEETKAIPTPR